MNKGKRGSQRRTERRYEEKRGLGAGTRRAEKSERVISKLNIQI